MERYGSQSSKSEGGVAALFEQEGDRNARLRHYLETGPRGERDVEALLDAKSKDVLPSGQTRGERDAWLRDILGPYRPTRQSSAVTDAQPQ